MNQNKAVLEMLGVKRPNWIAASSSLMLVAPAILVLIGQWQLGLGFFVGSFMGQVAFLVALKPVKAE